MLAYFVYTAEIQNFCQLMEFNIDGSVSIDRCTCMYSIKYYPIPRITLYNLDHEDDVLIPPEKVLEYLTLMLNGYSCREAVNALNVVGDSYAFHYVR